MARGKRVHKPITITKEVDQSSPKLLSALVSTEKLKQVVINFWHQGSTTDVEINFYRVTLTDAFIINISQDRPATPNMNSTILEKVEMIYEKIEWQYLDGSSLSAADDWKQINELEFQEFIEEATSEENEMMDEWEEQEENIRQ
jgi:type VI secretion system secreted protein Hcp